MGTGDLDPGLVPVPAAFLLARQVTLPALELVLCPAQEPGRGDLAAVGQHHEVGQAEIDADHWFRLGQDIRICLNDEAGEVPTCRIHEDRKSTRLNSSHSQISYAVFCLKKKRDPVLARTPRVQ